MARHGLLGLALGLALSAALASAAGPAEKAQTAKDAPPAAPASTTALADDKAAPDDKGKAPKKALAPDPPGMIRLLPDKDAWIDPKNKRVVVDGAVCLRQGQLEMFACTKGTKEHEAIIAVPVPAQVIHAALLKVGAKTGSPVQFRPKFSPATGDKINITCVWTDDKGEVHRDRAQDWVRDAKTKKPLESTWVFAGSGFWTDETTGEKYYQADGGYLVCLSNFPSAMLDLPMESSEQNASLLFEAFTDRVPPKGTRVRLVFAPEEKKG